jgi:hypothetical protein
MVTQIPKELRSWSGRGVVRALPGGLADHPEIVTGRFFWPTILSVGGIGRIKR